MKKKLTLKKETVRLLTHQAKAVVGGTDSWLYQCHTGNNCALPSADCTESCWTDCYTDCQQDTCCC